MKRIIGLMTIAAMLGFGTLALASKETNPSNQTQWMGGLPHVIKGKVLKIEGETYTIRDRTGRELRVHVDQYTKMDATTKVGDMIEVRVAHIPTDVYARSLEKAASAGSVLAPLPATVEGELLKIEGKSCLVQDVSGRKVRLQFDKATTKDDNLTVGDWIVARIDNLTAPGYATSIIKQ